MDEICLLGKMAFSHSTIIISLASESDGNRKFSVKKLCFLYSVYVKWVFALLDFIFQYCNDSFDIRVLG